MRNTFEKRLKERLSKEFQRFDKFIQIQMGTAEKTDCAREAFLEFAGGHIGLILLRFLRCAAGLASEHFTNQPASM